MRYADTGLAFRPGDVGSADGLAEPETAASVAASSTAEVPTSSALHGAHPNPFRGRTTLTYELPEAVHVRLAVYDVLGREVAVLVDGPVVPGAHQVAFDASALPSGVYVSRLIAGERTQSARLTLVR